MKVFMGRKAVTPLPQIQKMLSQMGEQIKLARLRRKLSSSLVAERAGIHRSTLTKIEKGSPSISIGAYANVLLALGLHYDILKIAQDDKLGRKLEDIGLMPKQRAPKRGTS